MLCMSHLLGEHWRCAVQHDTLCNFHKYIYHQVEVTKTYTMCHNTVSVNLVLISGLMHDRINVGGGSLTEFLLY